MGIKQWLRDSALVCAFVREPTAHEMFVGAEKPTITLTKMLILEMTQSVREIKPDYLSRFTAHWDFKSFVLHIAREQGNYIPFSRRKPGAESYEYETRVERITLKADPSYVFGGDEIALILKAYEKFFRLYTEWKRQESEFNRQQQAVDIIAKHLKVDNGNVHEGVRSADSGGQAQSIIDRKPVRGL